VGQSSKEIGKLLRGLIQKQVNTDLSSTDIIDSENQTPVKISNTKNIALIADLSTQVVFNISEEFATNHFPTFEPDGVDTRLWLKFQNAGKLHDYSNMGTTSYSAGEYNLPGLFIYHNSDNEVKYEMFSYFNGISHFAYTEDNPLIQFKNIIVDNNKNFALHVRMRPISMGKPVHEAITTVAQKIDDDQLRYGYCVTINSYGHMYFYVRKDYVQYHVFVKNAYAWLFNDLLYRQRGSFNPQNFNVYNFQTSYQYLCALANSPDLSLEDWVFNFNPTTNRLYVISNGETIAADSAAFTPKPRLLYPMQDGRWNHFSNTVFNFNINDASGNNNHAVISGTYGWFDFNELYNFGSNTAGTGDGFEVQVPAIAAANTLTEFTMSMFYDPETPAATNPYTYPAIVFSKGINVNNSFWVEHIPNTSQLKANIRTSSGTVISVTSPVILTPFAWNFVSFKWKSGEGIKLSVNNSTNVVSSPVTTTISNSTDNIRLLNRLKSIKGRIALFRFYTTQITDTDRTEEWNENYHNPDFPNPESIQPEPDPDPLPITVPYTTVYNLQPLTTPVPTASDYRYINSAGGDNPFFIVYGCTDGTSVVDPITERYSVPAGSIVPGNPVSSSVTVPSTDNSYNVLQKSGTNNTAVGIMIQDNTTGIGQELFGKVIKEAKFYLKGESSPTGTGYCRIWDASNNVVATMGQFNSANADPDDYEEFTFTNTGNTVAMGMGFTIGIEYSTGASSDIIKVQRRGINFDSSITQKSRKQADGSWGINDAFEIKTVLTYQYVTPDIDPYYILGSTAIDLDAIGELFDAGSSMIGISPTGAKFRVYVDPAIAGGTVQLQHISSTGVVRSVLRSVAATSLPIVEPTDFNYVWSNTNYNTPIVAGDRIVLVCVDTGPSSVYVLTNTGSNVNFDTNKSYLIYRDATDGWLPMTGLDISGSISSGGNNFDAFERFTPTKTIIGEKIVNAQSSMWNRRITKAIARSKKVGNPTGIMTCGIMDVNYNTKVLLGSVDVTTLSSTPEYANTIFQNPGSGYNTIDGDRVFLKYEGGTLTDTVELNMGRDFVDQQNSIAFYVDNGSTYDIGYKDLAGTIYIGGDLDVNSRSRIAQSIENQSSLLKGKKITRVILFLYKTTAATSGIAYCTVRRGIDDQLIATLGTVFTSTLSTDPAAPTPVEFVDLSNDYVMDVGDKLCFEFSGGNTTNRVGVLVQQGSYDLTYSFIRKFNELNYNDAEQAYDMVATVYVGGYTYTPAPNLPPDATPTAIKDLAIAVGKNRFSGHFECVMSELRIYSKEITLTMADNLYSNRYTISNIGRDEVLLPFTLKPRAGSTLG